MICSHGEEVPFCWDDARPGQRAAIDYLHRHAFDWAAEHAPTGDLFQMEAYSLWYAVENYRFVDSATPHSIAWERWAKRQTVTFPQFSTK